MDILLLCSQQGALLAFHRIATASVLEWDCKIIYA